MTEPAVDGIKSEEGPPTAKQSCIPYIDALWFCYTPVHQLTKYYRYGNVDDCLGHWQDLIDCFKSRTKFAPKATAQPKPPNPYWELRTKEEAAIFWNKEFGHLKKDKPRPPTGPTLI